MTRQETPSPARPRPILRFGIPLLLCLLIIWLLYFLTFHATRLPPSAPLSRATARQSGSELETVRETLRHDNQITGCRSAVTQLNSYLSRSPQAARPAALVDAERGQLKQLNLDEDETGEVASLTFTLLDAQHMDQCFLFQEAARSLGIDGLPDHDRALAAFAFAMRQVRLREPDGDACPPQFVLRRGWGSPLERSLVFVALLQQLGIPGCMIALPEEGKEPRYWIPGALADGEILLFDARLGLPLPGQERGSILTLAQLRTSPELLQALPADKELPYDVTAPQAQRAEPHIAVPLSALAPRMRFLNTEVLGPSNKVRFASDPATLLQSFQKATDKRAFIGSAVGFWAPPATGNSALRSLRQFLPPEEGGADRPLDPRKPWVPRRSRFGMGLPAWQFLPASVRLLKEDVNPGLRLREEFARPFVEFSLEPRKPRDLMLRGRLEEATAGLVKMLGELDQLRTALQAEPNLAQEVTAWLDEARTTQADLLIAEKQAERTKTPEALATLKSAQARVADVWDPKKSQKPRLALVGAAAAPLGAETTYCLALCKHEQAEQAQSAFERRKGKTIPKDVVEAWRDAASWWKKYLDEHPAGRDEAAARLHWARALEKQGDKAAARALLASPPPRASPWEKLAFKVRLTQLQD